MKRFAVTCDKKVVGRYFGGNAGFHPFHVLTTNGVPVEPHTWK